MTTHKPLKIAVWYNMPHCGAKRALYSHVKGLVERGHQVTCWTTSLSDRQYLPLSDLVTEHIVDLPRRWRTQAGPLATFFQPYQDTLFNIEGMKEHSRQCAAQINAGDFDVVFVNQCASFAVSYLGRYLSQPKLLYLQDPLRVLYEATPTLPWMAKVPAVSALKKLSPLHWKNVAYDHLCVSALRQQLRDEWENVRTYDNVLVNSYFSREAVARAYGIAPQVCYLGIDTSHFASPVAIEREDFVLGVGQIAPRKNLELAIEAISLIPSPRPKLVWVGNAADAGYLQQLQTQAAQSGVEFELRIRVSDEELIRALHQARLMLYVPKLEPFGLAPLEANACGTPAVGIREGGLRETIQDGVNGLLAEPQAQAVAQAIATLWSDPALAQRLGQQGRKLVADRWNEPDSITRLENRLAEVYSNHRTSKN